MAVPSRDVRVPFVAPASKLDVDQGARHANVEILGGCFLSAKSETSAKVTSHKPPRRSPVRTVKSASPSTGVEDAAIAKIGQRATMVRARPQQHFAITTKHAETVYLVHTGMLILQTGLPDKRRQLLTLLYPQDIFRPCFAPPLPEASLFAVVTSEIWCMPAHALESLGGSDPELARFLHRQLANQHARAILHVTAIGVLNGEERVASFLIELALRIGSPSSGGISFDIPLSRIDIADYLTLNADTLSRIMSRLKARGVVTQTEHRRVSVPDWEALCAQSPIADALVALHGPAASKLGCTCFDRDDLAVSRRPPNCADDEC